MSGLDDMGGHSRTIETESSGIGKEMVMVMVIEMPIMMVMANTWPKLLICAIVAFLSNSSVIESTSQAPSYVYSASSRT